MCPATLPCTEPKSILDEGKATCGNAEFCDMKMDGAYYDKNVLTTCDDDTVVRRQDCSLNQLPCKAGMWGNAAACGDPEWCKGKPDGTYCDGTASRVTCRSWKVHSRSVCSSGQPCTSGTGAVSRTAACGWDPDICNMKRDGRYCDAKGNARYECKGSNVVLREYCGTLSCTEATWVQSFGTPEAWCGNKLFCGQKFTAGSYCDGNYVTTCGKDQTSEGRTLCRDEPCKAGTFDGEAGCGGTTFCDGKMDGDYCDGSNMVKTCSSFKEIRKQWCYDGLKCNVAPGFVKAKAMCGDPAFCKKREEGSYCAGKYRVVCDSQASVSSVSLPRYSYCGDSVTCKDTGQVVFPNSPVAVCGTNDFCETKTGSPPVDGSYCESESLLVQCKAGKKVTSTYCAAASCSSATSTDGSAAAVLSPGAWCSNVMHKGLLYRSPCNWQTLAAVDETSRVVCFSGASFECTKTAALNQFQVKTVHLCENGCSNQDGRCCKKGNTDWCVSEPAPGAATGAALVNGTRVYATIAGPNRNECTDDTTFIDSKGFSCRDWAGHDCNSGGNNDVVELLQRSCPNACGMCGTSSGTALYGSGSGGKSKKVTVSAAPFEDVVGTIMGVLTGCFVCFALFGYYCFKKDK